MIFQYASLRIILAFPESVEITASHFLSRPLRGSRSGIHEMLIMAVVDITYTKKGAEFGVKTIPLFE
jgi:hypothetical protein